MQSYRLPPPHLLWGVTCSDSIRIRTPPSSWQRPKEGKENFCLGWMWGQSQSLIICVALAEQHHYSHADSSHPDTTQRCETSNLHAHTLLMSLLTDHPGRKTLPRETWASVQHPVYSSSRDFNKKNSSSKNRSVCQGRQKSPQAKRFQVRPISQGDFGLHCPLLYPSAVPVTYPNSKEFHKRAHSM